MVISACTLVPATMGIKFFCAGMKLLDEVEDDIEADLVEPTVNGGGDRWTSGGPLPPH